MCELFKHGIDTFFAPSAMGQVLFYHLKSRYPHAHIHVHTSRTHNCIHAFKSTPDSHIRRTPHLRVQDYISVKSSFFFFFLDPLYKFRYYIMLKLYFMLFHHSASIPKYPIARMIFYCCHQPLIVRVFR